MKVLSTFFLTCLLLTSCSHKKQIVYVSDSFHNNLSKAAISKNSKIEIGDILKIDIQTVVPEASNPYSTSTNETSANTINLLVINGYLVNEKFSINLPKLGDINVENQTESSLTLKIREMLIDGGHLNDPYVKVKKINSKFTVLGEVKNPGTFNFYDDKLSVFQALGYAGDLLISAKRENITLIREENGLVKTYKFSLLKSDLLDKPFYNIKNNDVIIVDPNFSKIKSAGFIGSPQSIASISSLLLSITLLLINN